MRIIRFFPILLVLIFLAACASPSTPESGPAVSDNPAPAGGESPEDSTSDGPAAPFEPPEGGGAMSGCVLQTLIRPPDATETSIFEPVSPEDWQRGPANAPVTIIAYGDFQCPGCAPLATVLAQLNADFPQEVRLVYRHFPQPELYDKAGLTFAAAEAAGAQGKFWEMHDLLFASQATWSGQGPEAFRSWVTERGQDIGLDGDQIAEDLADPAYDELAQERFDDITSLGIPGTPFLLINGRIYDGPTDYDNLNLIVRLLSLQELQYTNCPPVVIDPSRAYIATIETEKGSIVIELLPGQAPLAVNNFVFLASNGWYDGVTFHRVLEGYIAQAGDPSGTGFGGPGYAFINEDSALKFDSAGLVAMANSGRDTNGSQFFITFAPAPALDGGYTIFGRVLEGLDVARSLTIRDPQQGVNLPPGDEIITVTIRER